jgi:hypothetical protein
VAQSSNAQPRANADNETSFNSNPSSGQTASTNSTQKINYQFVHHDMIDPTARSLRPRSNQDSERRDAMSEKGGACLPCGQAKIQCDPSDHCRNCVHKNLPSEKEFWASIKSTLHQPGLEHISLDQLSTPTERVSSTTNHSRGTDTNHAHDHLNAWFHNITCMIDSEPFLNDFTTAKVSLKITSASNEETTETNFSLPYEDISTHLDQSTYSLVDFEDSLVAAFLGHSSAPKPALQHGRSPSQSVEHLSWVVTKTFDFLQSFEKADMYAALIQIPAARASVSVIYSGLYRLLLEKANALCSFVLASLKQKFRYCTRRTFKKVVKDSLCALAEYHRVLTRLAEPKLGSSSEVAALFQCLRDRAATILRHRGTERLFLRVYNRLKGPKLTFENTSQFKIEELINEYCTRPSNLKALSIALCIIPVHSDTAPVPTAAFRDTDPYNQHRPVKVSDLLKESESSTIDPKQMVVNSYVDNINDPDLGHGLPELAEGSNRSLSLFFSQVPSDSTYVESQSLLMSLNREHASERPSQDDTDLESFQSESTIQNILGLDSILSLDDLGHGLPEQVGGSNRSPSLFFGRMPSDSTYVETQSLLTSLNREHASERPSQDDTDLESFQSESTIQNTFGLDSIFSLDVMTQAASEGSEPKESPDVKWQGAPRRKGRKRRKGSRDSSNSDHSADRGGRKHVRSGSPSAACKQNYYSIFTSEPTRLP